MRLVLLILFLFVISNNSISQHQFGITLNPGISKFSSSVDNYGDSNKSVFRFSGNGGLFYGYHWDKIYFGVDLQFIQIEGKDRFKILYTNSTGVIVDEDFVYFYRHLSYIGIPIYIGFKTKKFNLLVGFQYQYLIREIGIDKGEVEFNGNIYKWENKYDDLNIKASDFGLNFGFEYSVNQKISLKLKYYLGLRNLYEDPSESDLIGRNHQLTLGINYSFLKNKDSE